VHVSRDAAADSLRAFREVNVEGTRALLHAARAAGVRRFVFVSSTKAVGEWTERPWTDAEPPRPLDPYGVSKLEAERVVRALADEAGLHAPILRLPLAYGPGAKGNILRLFDAVARGAPLPFASIRNRRSLLFAGNFVAAVDAVVASAAAARETFFVSDGQDLSTPELIRLIADALGRRARLIPVPPAIFRAAARIGDAAGRRIRVPFDSAVERRLLGSLAVDITRFRQLTGYTPPHTPAEGLRAMAAWYLGRTGAP
jgi:UDP-glucose 4-epimerase